MDIEHFIKQFDHAPAIYYHGDGEYRIRPYSFGKLNLINDIIQHTIYGCLKELAIDFCKQKGIKYIDGDDKGSIPDHGAYYKLPGVVMHVPAVDLPTIYKIQSLPTKAKIVLMELSDNEIRSYITDSDNETKKRIQTILKQKWKYKETGDILTLEDYVSNDFRLMDVVKKAKSVKTTIQELETLIRIFEGPHTDLLMAEEEAKS